MKIGLEEHELLLFVVHLSATRWMKLISICQFWIAAQLFEEGCALKRSIWMTQLTDFK